MVSLAPMGKPNNITNTFIYAHCSQKKKDYLSYAFKIIKSNFIFIKIKKVIDKQKHKKGEVLCASL